MEKIKKHEEAIRLLELIHRARILYRNNHTNATTYKRAGIYPLQEKFNHKANITKMAIKRLTKRYVNHCYFLIND